MGALKHKIQAATLMETLVATAIILGVFIISSLVLNNTFRAVVANNDFSIQNRLNFLEYLEAHEQLELPYYEDIDAVSISVEREQIQEVSYIVYRAVTTGDLKELIRYRIDETP